MYFERNLVVFYFEMYCKFLYFAVEYINIYDLNQLFNILYEKGRMSWCFAHHTIRYKNIKKGRYIIMKFSMKKMLVSSVALFTAAAMMVTGCGGSDGAASGGASSSTAKTVRPDPNMEIKMATTDLALSTGQLAMPWRTISFVSSRLYRNLFVATIGETDVAPDLAESYVVSEDGLVYEIIMDSGVAWSDGETIDAEDVRYSIESFLLLGEASTVQNLFKTAFLEIVGAEAFLADPSVGLEGLVINGNKITITLDNPNNLFLAVLSQFAIMPEHAFVGVDPVDLFQTNLEYWQEPVVSGMYKLGERVPDEYIRLVYNDQYAGGDAPYINSILLRNDFEYDELDYTETNDVSNILDYRASATQIEYELNSIFYRYFVFNIDKGGELDPVLSDIRVRQALMHAIDRESIIRNVYYGIGTVNNTAAVYEYDNPIEFDYAYDPDKALALLKEAEYDFDRPVTLLLYYSDDVSMQFMQEVAKCMEEIGLTVNVMIGNLYDDASDHYDLGLKGLPVFSIEDWYNEYLSTSQLHTDVYGGDPMFDDLVIDLKKANGAEERNVIMAELQELEYDLFYKAPLFIMGHKVYVSDKVILPNGVEFGDSKYKYYLNFGNWKMDTSK